MEVRCARLLLVVLLALTVVAASAQAAPRQRAKRPTVVIHRTSYGIPRIQATTYLGAGEGYGYAFAQDDLCTMANDYVTVNAQRSQYFGPTGTYLQGGNGVTVSNLDSDFFFQLIELASGDVVIPGIAEAAPPTPPVTSSSATDPGQTARLIALRLPPGGLGAIGSNAVAIGRGGARDHTHGVLLGNPHFPWI